MRGYFNKAVASSVSIAKPDVQALVGKSGLGEPGVLSPAVSSTRPSHI